jgi:hypothetical protein
MDTVLTDQFFYSSTLITYVGAAGLGRVIHVMSVLNDNYVHPRHTITQRRRYLTLFSGVFLSLAALAFMLFMYGLHDTVAGTYEMYDHGPLLFLTGLGLPMHCLFLLAAPIWFWRVHRKPVYWAKKQGDKYVSTQDVRNGTTDRLDFSF